MIDVTIREAIEADISSTYGSGFRRSEKSDSRYVNDVVYKAKAISDFLSNVDDAMSVLELREQLDEIANS